MAVVRLECAGELSIDIMLYEYLQCSKMVPGGALKK